MVILLVSTPGDCDDLGQVRARGLDDPLVVLLDDGDAGDAGDALELHVHQLVPEGEEGREVGVLHVDPDDLPALLELGVPLAGLHRLGDVLGLYVPLREHRLVEVELDALGRVDLAVVDDVPDPREEDVVGDLHGLLLGVLVPLVEVDVHGGLGGDLPGVDELHEPRKTQCDVPLLHSCEVEGPERHLRARLAYRLGRDYARGLSRLHGRVVYRLHHLVDDVLHALLGEVGLSASLCRSSLKRRLLSLLSYLCEDRLRLLLAELAARAVGQLRGAQDPVEVDRTAVVGLGRVDAVLSVEELDDVAGGVPDREVVLDAEVLHRVDEPPLHVSALLGPDGRVDEPFPPSHGVEEELRRGEPVAVVSLHKALGLRGEVAWREVAERPPAEALLDPLSSDRLLPEGGGHLPEVEARAPRAGAGHDDSGVLDGERPVGYPACPVSRL